MPTTIDRLEAVRNQIQTLVDRAEADDNRDFTSDERAQVTALVEEGKELRAAFEADRSARDAVREIGNLGEAGDAVQNINDVERLEDGRRADPAGRTFGQLFTESTEFRNFIETHARGGVIPASAKGLNSGTFQSGLNVRNLITGASDTSAGALVQEDRRPGVTDLVPFRERSVLDVITMGNTTSDAVEYVRVTSKTNNAAPVAEATTADLPTQDGSTGALIQAAGGGYKPESAMALEVVTTNVKTIAHWLPVTKRAASDASQIMTLVDNFLMEGLYEEAEDQVVAGDGTGENFTGILNTSGILTVGSAGTDLDAIVDAIRSVRVTGKRRPTALVIHPNDWYSTGFLLAKDGDQRYLVGDPRASVDDLQSLWGLQVVVSEAVTENTAIVGDFRYAVMWEREGVSVTMTDSHADFFVRNLLAILAEMRAAFGILDPQAFCTVTAV